MIPERIGTITERIGNLFRVYDSGLIDTPAYTKELRALQDEFLSPEIIAPKVLEEPSEILSWLARGCREWERKSNN